MQAKWKAYLHTLFHGFVEVLGIFPALLMLAVLFVNPERFAIWFGGILLLFFVSFLIRTSMSNRSHTVPFVVPIFLLGIGSWFLLDSLPSSVASFLLGLFIIYRGIQHSEKDWQELMPARIYWMVSIPLYIVMYVFFVFNERFTPYKDWLSVAGCLFMIIMVFASNQQKLQQASYSKDKREKIGSDIQRINQIYLVITLFIVFLVASFQKIQAAIASSMKSMLDILISPSENMTVNSNAGMKPPPSTDMNLQIGNGSKETSLPDWLDRVLFILGITIVIIIFLLIMAIFFKNFRSMIRKSFSWLFQLLGRTFNLSPKNDNGFEYKDEKENLFDWKKWRKEVKERYQELSRKVKRKPKFEQMSLEEKIRFIYRFLADEVKQQEKWHTSLTAREVIQLNENRKNLDDFKAWYDDIRYGQLELKEIEREEVDKLWMKLQSS